MRRLTRIFAAFALIGLAACTSADQSVTNGRSLSDFTGTYLGVSMTNDSPVGIGEFEVVITRTEMRLRLATGMNIKEGRVPLSRFAPMTAREVGELFTSGSGDPARITGFKYTTGTGEYPKYLFVRDPASDEPGLLILHGDIRDALSMTILFNPPQIARGDYKKMLEEMESDAKNAGGSFLPLFPRLQNGGKPGTQKNEMNM